MLLLLTYAMQNQGTEKKTVKSLYFNDLNEF